MPSTVPEAGPVCPGGPRACHRLAPGERIEIIKRLVGARMAVFFRRRSAFETPLAILFAGAFLVCYISRISIG